MQERRKSKHKFGGTKVIKAEEEKNNLKILKLKIKLKT